MGFGSTSITHIPTIYSEPVRQNSFRQGDSRDPKNGTPLWQASHTITIPLRILMGVVWE